MTLSPERPFCFTTKTSPGYLVRRANQLLVPLVEVMFADQEFSLTQLIALKFISSGHANTSAALARALGHDSGATTRLIDQLEERGLLSRRRSGEDRRVVMLECTAPGQAAVEAMAPRLERFWQIILSDFSPPEVEALISLLTRLVDKLEATDSG